MRGNCYTIKGRENPVVVWLEAELIPAQADGEARVTVSNDGAGGYVIIDAVQFKPVQ